MVVNAILTNAVSNALHASFLFIYFIGALIHYFKKDHTFSLLIVFFFLTLFILKILGVYVHYYDANAVLPPAWIAISLLTIMLNYLVVQAMEMPEFSRMLVVFLSIVSSFLFIVNGGSFAYIALPLMIIYLIAAYYSRAMLRWGFVMVVISNIIWIVSRYIENHIAGHEISAAYRYDNDVYHLLLIISTFIIYKAIAQGYWKHPA